jgi:arylsulfatase
VRDTVAATPDVGRGPPARLGYSAVVRRRRSLATRRSGQLGRWWWLLAAAVPASSIACGGTESPRAAAAAGKLDAAPSIVVVTLDTLRADHLGCYGYHRDTSPNIDALAAEGVLFERAMAPMATTLPSHVSLFSGVHPHRHGVRENRWGRPPFGEEAGLRSAAELLRADGYTTAAFVSAAPVKKVTGLGSGFDTFEEPPTYDRKGPGTTDQAIAWLEATPREPFLLWVHLWDPHEPNRPEAPWAGKFPSDEGLERVIDERGIDPERLSRAFAPPALRRFLSAGPDASAAAESGGDAATDGGGAQARGTHEGPRPRVDRDAVRDMLNRYDADVAATDHEVGRLIAALRARDLLDRAVVVVTADHGQSLGQHDWLPHGRITNDNLHVPLVMRFPPGVVGAPARFPRVVSLVDVLPTVLARFDGAANRLFLAQAAGEDVLGGVETRGWALAQRTSRRRAGWAAGEEYALVADRFKYVRRAEGTEELYDLAADPGERADVSAREGAALAELRKAFRAAFDGAAADGGEVGASGDQGPSEEHIEALRSLGYLDE